MRPGWGEPRWLVCEGVALLAAGYIALASSRDPSAMAIAGGRVAFYSGLTLLLAGVVIWLRQPPQTDNTSDDSEDPDESDEQPDNFEA
jgi:hypothetical protein